MKMLLASLVLFASTSSFASARMEAPKDLRWAETPKIISTSSCGDTKICYGLGITSSGSFPVTCKTSNPEDCPDAITCFNRNILSDAVSVVEATTKLSTIPSYGRDSERGSRGKGKDITRFPEETSK